MAQSIDRDVLRKYAAQSLSTSPRPFLRWAGSKRAFLGQLVHHLPQTFNRYWEPFLGSGSLFFLLRPQQAWLSDMCAPLIATYRAVRDGPNGILRHLDAAEVSRAAYYRIRESDPTSRYARAARFIYLNKACWNGLYRVNSLGQFNVPYGMPKTNNVIDADNLRACAALLRTPTVTIANIDFEEALAGVRQGDLVYLDPPYVTRHNNNGFIDYNERLFSWRDQERLARVAKRLVERGAHVLVSNADHSDVIELFDDFERVRFERSSTLASDASKRGRVYEAIFVGAGK